MQLNLHTKFTKIKTLHLLLVSLLSVAYLVKIIFKFIVRRTSLGDRDDSFTFSMI